MSPIELVIIGENESFLRLFSFIINSIQRNILVVQFKVNEPTDFEEPDLSRTGLFLVEDGEITKEAMVQNRLLQSHKVVIVSDKPDLARLKYYLKLGAAGLCSRESAIKDLEYILKSVVFKNIYVCPQYTKLLFSFLRNSRVDVSLSAREKQILQLLCKGYTYSEVSKDLNLALETVKKHISNLYSKLEVSSKGQAINKAMKMDLTGHTNLT